MIRWCLATFLVLVVSWSAGCGSSNSTPPIKVVTSTSMSISTPEDEALLKKLCLQCHLFSEPDTLAKSDWDDVIHKMVTMPGYGRAISPQRFDLESVKRWFREAAPDSLRLSDRANLPEHAPPLRRVVVPSPDSNKRPFVSQLKLLVSSSNERSLLSCDMRNGWICETTALDGEPELRILTQQIGNACRLELTDLNGKGGRQFLVANLGSFVAMDHSLGSVDWLGEKPDAWNSRTLSSNLGRVADLKPFDFDADGDLDIAVAEFGWRTTGRVLLLENNARKSAKKPDFSFLSRTLDERHGAVQLEIIDLDGNGRPDVIALLAQEHEVLVAYLSQPDGTFVPHELFRAPHPVWGYSGFQLLDFDGDHDVDVLLTNGDMMDGPTLKPYHSISWLENMGDLKFTSHTLAELPGAHRAEAADLDGDGDLDVVACTLVPDGTEQQAKLQHCSIPPGLVWLEQTAPGKFDFHVWKRGPGRYPTLTTGDFDGDGKADVALGIGLWQKPNSTDTETGYVELWLSSPAP